MITFLNEKVRLATEILSLFFFSSIVCFSCYYLKNNWELHLAFFDAIVDIATQIGYRSLDIVEALLQQVELAYCLTTELIVLLLTVFSQGLTDTEEWVIFWATDAMTKLCDNCDFNQSFIMSLLQQIVPFFGHPLSQIVCS